MKLKNYMNSRVQNVLQNAISAQYIYQKKSKIVNLILLFISLLSILVPIVVFIALYMLKDTSYKNLSDLVATIISALLLVLSVFSIIMKFDDKKIDYLIGSRSNRNIEERARNFLDETDDSKLEQFFSHVIDVDNYDREKIGDISDDLRKEAYREALKKVSFGADAICPICNASPFKYTEGSCQTCGNTPEGKNESE